VKRNYKVYLGLLFGSLFLYLAVRKIDYGELFSVISHIRWQVLLLCVFLNYLSYVTRALRWRYLIRSVKEIPFRPLFSATVIGFGANNMLPVRIGELVRAYVLAKMEKIKTSSAFATILLERVFDGFMILVMLVVVLFAVNFPSGYGELRLTLRILGFVSLGFLVGLLGFLLFFTGDPQRAAAVARFVTRPLSQRAGDKLDGIIGSFLEGLMVLYRGRDIVSVIFYSILTWLVIVTFYYSFFWAFTFAVPYVAAVFLTVALAFAVMIPAPPGYIGTYHAAARYALVFYGLGAEEAVGMGIIMHGVSFLSAIILGLLFLWIERMSFLEVSALGREELERNQTP
jgi:uncharacterized protein (TIRG00374 family)